MISPSLYLQSACNQEEVVRLHIELWWYASTYMYTSIPLPPYHTPSPPSPSPLLPSRHSSLACHMPKAITI